jgi:hypothetical protein
MIGDKDDQFARLKALMPRGWYGDDTTIIDALLQGIAYAKAFAWSLIAYVASQTRIKTATDGFLDMIAADFFGDKVQRKAGQGDDSFRNTIVINMFRERATRAALVKVLTDLTGRAPLVFEPMRPMDTGSYGGPMIGYGVAGGYGSMLHPFQAFVTVYRPTGTGIPNVAGYGVSTGGYSTPSQSEYASMDMVQGNVTDADIYAAIDSVKPVGTTIWTQITN